MVKSYDAFASHHSLRAAKLTLLHADFLKIPDVLRTVDVCFVNNLVFSEGEVG